ncbi:type II toxin-antitoxin system HicB family antitoxin [Candidatus Dojkabacteria bacterium]|jgi:predicted RNase H-like HicB family nuclease|uniref:Type II toxin-antitoxin system HicB family antitoxin n=1 Tax=Candidatus Dojkabacteria bacterium TaxID=2099670 RepID=A0A955I9A9_9BACT|nr:type II toxin-antitoxin system HicB family antitoxin [Candidatus Dojkabacteria bacterium]
MNHNFTITTWKEDDLYVAQCLDVDVSSFGTTQNEALENIKEAIELYLEDSKELDIPDIKTPAITQTKISLNA